METFHTTASLNEGLRIAIVDPNEEVLHALKRRLTAQREVSAVAALPLLGLAPEVIDGLDPHAVLVDVRGNSVAGAEALAEIFALPSRADRFIVAAHVALVDVRQEAHLLAAGCELYLPKGLWTADLVGRLSAAIQQRLPPSRWPAALKG
jgi:DNA-binding NarL/FixJ family response regulator